MCKNDTQALWIVLENQKLPVNLTQNFDEVLVPADHVSRSPNDTYYVDSDTGVHATCCLACTMSDLFTIMRGLCSHQKKSMAHLICPVRPAGCI